MSFEPLLFDSSPMDTSLHHRFNSLSMLLPLVTAINNQGHPTFQQDDEAAQKAQDENDASSRIRVLNALAALLVQNHEIVAVTAHEPPCEHTKFREVTVICNPDEKDKYFSPGSSAQCTLVAKGNSHYDTVTAGNKWAGMLSLR